MNSNKITLKDIFYSDSHSSIAFTLKDSKIEEGTKIFYFEVTITFEDNEIFTDFTMFDHDIKNLKRFTYTFPVSEIYFMEPDLSFTLIDFNSAYLSVYMNLDSGLRYSNIGTESGLAIRLNVTNEAFSAFLAQLSAFD